MADRKGVTLLNHARILVAEDEPFIAFDIANSVEAAGGEVAGPVGSVREGLTLLQNEPVTAAILDVNLGDRDVTPIAQFLMARDIPIVFHTGVGLPAALAKQYPDLTLCRKPTDPAQLVRAIEEQICAPEKTSR
jgi:DNA-binding NtrC family response regulator